VVLVSCGSSDKFAPLYLDLLQIIKKQDMRTWKTAALLSLGSMAFFTACDDDDDDGGGSGSGITIPTEYVSADFETNAAAELAMTSTLGSFTSAMKAADKGNTVVIGDLTANWDNTTLKTATSSSYQGVVDTELPRLVTASGSGDFDWSTAPNNGGHFEGRVFNPYGLECVQVVEKGLFGAALYNEANRIINTAGNNITGADIDRLVALFGTTPAFPNSDKVSENPDKYGAKYAARRTPSAGGLYLNMKKYFIEAKAYAEAGASYNSQKAMALDNLMKEWEKALAATTINYLYATVDKLSQTNPDDATIEDGMHAYSEGVGFLSGVSSVSNTDRMLSDEAAEHALEHMKAPFGEAATSYLFVNDAANELSELTTALDELQKVYSFSDEDMEGFKKNWVSEEGR
jgi:hypothetical protein